MSDIVLYDYWRSSASYRVRIALNLLGLDYRAVPVDLLAGEQLAPEHLERNPQGFVPVLDIDGLRLTQSLAIIEYLHETRGGGFLPADPAEKARLRALAQIIAMDTHPICNPSVLSQVLPYTDRPEYARAAWMKHFIRRGLEAFELALDHPNTNPFCHGSSPGLADMCLVPQLYNADRWGAGYADLSRIRSVARHCIDLEAVRRAEPQKPL